MAPLDCILVGHNERAFDDRVRQAHQFRAGSGNYTEVLINSVRRRGKRVQYMDVFNDAYARASGARHNLDGFEAASLAPVYLRNYLAKKGLAAEIVNYFNSDKTLFADLLARAPVAVAITTTFQFETDAIAEIVEFVRARSPNTKIVVGGPYVLSLALGSESAPSSPLLSLSHRNHRAPDVLEYLFRKMGADAYICEPQGEATLAELLSRYKTAPDAEPRTVANLYYGSGGHYLSTPKQEEDNDLNGCDIDWRNMPGDLLNGSAFIRTARSCPFACSFCTFPTMAGDHRTADVETIERELFAARDAGIKQIAFVDDTFNVPLPRFKHICRMMIRNRFDFRWISFFRCTNADEEAFDLMKESGCVGVILGIESGDPGILETMNKKVNLQRYHWGIQELHKRDIVTNALFIVGFPGETEGSVENTIQFIESAQPTTYSVGQYFHSNRNPISKRAAEFSLTGNAYSWKHATMTWQTASELTKKVIRTVKNSVMLPPVGFSLWVLPYMMAQGFSREFFIEFCRATHPMLVRSLDDQDCDLSAEDERLVALFRTYLAAQGPRSPVTQADVAHAFSPQ
jgi:radical SAM PhpK family P-methyltransferase